MKEKLEKLAELWPKDSQWRQQDAFHGVIFLHQSAPDIASMLRWDRDDRYNAAARTIIEDELIRLGWSISWEHNRKFDEFEYCAGLASRVGPTRTEALVDVAIAVLSS